MNDIQNRVTVTTSSETRILFSRATEEHAAGRLNEAVLLCQEVLLHNPAHADSHHLLGGIALQRGRLEHAADFFQKAVVLDNSIPEYQYNLATALGMNNRLDEAITWYEGALRLKPQFLEALNDLGDVFVCQDRLDEACRKYEEALTLNPNLAEILCKLGDALQVMGRKPEAIRRYESAVAIAPNFVVALSNLGSALYGERRFDDAVLRYEQCLSYEPNSSETLCNLGNALYAAGRIPEAIARYQVAITLNTSFPKALCNLGDALLALGRCEEAASQYEQALSIEPNIPEGLCNLGDALQAQDKLTEAIVRYRRALSVKPNMPEALCNMGNALLNLGQVASAIELYTQAISIRPSLLTAHSNRLMAFHYVGSPCSALILRHAKRCAELYDAGTPLPIFERHEVMPRRIRVGYVSSDFSSHPVGYFIARVLPEHDRTNVEIFCYSSGASSDDLTSALRASADHWRDIGAASDIEVLQLIRNDSIDILVDLSGHTKGNRLAVFAMRAAPVQVSWLGYFGTTGLSTMDYILADSFVVPLDQTTNFVETVWHLPDSYLCFAPPTMHIPVARTTLEPGAPFVFGCFSNLAKASPEAIGLWCSVLNRVPKSKLLLKAKGLEDKGVCEHLLQQMLSHGIAPERITFLGASSREDYLATYQHIDLVLDTTPFSGGTTTAEALWMGVPVVTLRGQTWAGRICESILSAVGLSDMVASTTEEYVEISARLAADEEGLTALRFKLRAQVEASHLCDAPRFTRNLDTCYRTIWGSWTAQRTVQNRAPVQH